MGEIKIKYMILYTTHKNKFKIDQDINVRAKTIKVLGKNIGVNLYGVGLGNGFLDKTPKAQATTTEKR